MLMISEKTVNNYWRRHALLMKFGFRFKLIGGYGDYFLERLRDVYYGGIPASILLLNPASCRRKCYDRAVLACCALKDFDYQVVHANIDSIRYNKKTVEEVNHLLEQGVAVNDKYPNHCFVEVRINGRTLVIDTTDGLIYDKNLYYLINRPQVNCVRTKEETMAFPDYIDIENADLERDKWAAITILPVIEAQIEEDSMYKEQAKREIALFKERIQFDDLVRQYEEEKKEHFEGMAKLKKEMSESK